MIKRTLPYLNLVFTGCVVYLWIKAPAAWPLWLVSVLHGLYLFAIGLLLSRGWRFVPPIPDNSDYLADQEADRDYYSQYDQR